MPSIAVEFDTYDNDPTNHIADPSGNHLAIVKNGYNLGSGAHLASYNPSYSLKSGSPLSAWVEYNGSTLRVYLNTTSTKPADPILTYSLALSSIFTGTSLYAGFTGGDGNADQFIHSWTLDTNPVPLPGALLLFGTGLVGLGAVGLRRRKRS